MKRYVVKEKYYGFEKYVKCTRVLGNFSTRNQAHHFIRKYIHSSNFNYHCEYVVETIKQ